MRYTHSINAVKCIEWGINLAQGALFDLLNQSCSWAEPQVIDGKIYYWVSRNKVIQEIPLAYNKPDTVYRALKLLAEKGLIIHIKDGKKDLINLTEKGKTWNVKGTPIGDALLGNRSDLIKNSEIDPTKLGNRSETNSEIDPTYKNTNIHKNINNKSKGLDDFSNVYHPSHNSDQLSNQSPNLLADDNWHWKDPFPEMSVFETEKYIKQNKRKGENNNKAYKRLLSDMRGSTQC